MDIILDLFINDSYRVFRMKTQIVKDAPALDSVQAGRVALKGFFGVMDAWGVDSGDQRVLLGGLPRSTYHKYRKLPEVSLGRDLLERISYVLGIYKSLHILFQDPVRANRWVRKANAAAPFGGKSALDRMLAGSITDLAAVRGYLDDQRGW